MRPKRWATLILILSLWGVSPKSIAETSGPISRIDSADFDSGVTAISVPLETQLGELRIEQTDDGLLVTLEDGQSRLTPQRFVESLYEQQKKLPRGWFFKFLNISTWAGVIWVSLGLLGQIFFTGRMLVQWLASERSKRSVVPVAFWWMSVVGAMMLVIYFVWRKDVVGVLGQSAGLFIYLRNLRLIYRAPREVTIGIDPAPQPELPG